MKKSLRAAAMAAALALALSAIGTAPASAKTDTTGKIGITVTAPGGVPIPKAQVTVKAKEVASSAEGETGYAKRSNINGRVVTPEMAPGVYTVTAQLTEPAVVSQSVEATVTAGADTSGVIVVLSGVQFITGRATANGEPVSGRVNATDGENSYGVGTTRYGAGPFQGEYRLLVKPGVAYKVVLRPRVSNEDWLATYAGDTVRGVDARTITPSASEPTNLDIAAYDEVGTIRGRVLNPSGSFAQGARVEVCAVNRERCVSTRSVQEGAYALRGLPAGSYTLYSSSATSSGTAAQIDGIRVRAGETTRTNVALRKEPRTPTPDGRILLTMTAPSTLVKAGDACATVVSAETDISRGDCLRPGERKLAFTGLESGTHTIALDGANTARTVTVRDGAITRVSMTRPTGTTLTGKVTTSAGKAAAGVHVWATDANGTGIAQDVVTTASGSYRLPFVTTGSYRVSFYPGSGSDLPTEKSVRVTGAGPVLNARLPKPATLTGKVVDQDGEPVAGIYVYAKYDGAAKTNSKGVYVIRGLQSGSVRLSTHDYWAGGFIDARSSTVTAVAGKTVRVPTITVRD